MNKYVIQIITNISSIYNFTIQNSSKNGINIDGSGSIIENNIFQNNSYLGISVKNSTYAIISNNTIRFNERGLCLCLNCFNTTIKNNIIEKNKFCGLYLYNSCNNIVQNNKFDNNGCGIIVSRSNNNIFSYNNIKNCKKCGFNLFRSSDNNITYNNFLKSTICSFFTCCENNWDSNFWNRPRILPKSIFGIKKEFIFFAPTIEYDWNPLYEPYNLN